MARTLTRTTRIVREQNWGTNYQLVVVGQLFELQNTGNEPWDAQIDIQMFPLKSASAAEDLDGPEIAGASVLEFRDELDWNLQRHAARKPDFKCAYSRLVACAGSSGFLPGSPATGERSPREVSAQLAADPCRCWRPNHCGHPLPLP